MEGWEGNGGGGGGGGGGGRSRQGSCFKCGQWGHWAASCPSAIPEQPLEPVSLPGCMWLRMLPCFMANGSGSHLCQRDMRWWRWLQIRVCSKHR